MLDAAYLELLQKLTQDTLHQENARLSNELSRRYRIPLPLKMRLLIRRKIAAIDREIIRRDQGKHDQADQASH